MEKLASILDKHFRADSISPDKFADFDLLTSGRKTRFIGFVLDRDVIFLDWKCLGSFRIRLANLSAFDGTLYFSKRIAGHHASLEKSYVARYLDENEDNPFGVWNVIQNCGKKPASGELTQFPPLTYSRTNQSKNLDRVREMAKTGDIVFTYDRTSGLASLIRRFDWIMWSHCAIVGTDGALFEATTAGTVQSSFDDLRSESLDVGLYRPQKELSSDEQAMVDQFCKSHLGIPYDWYAVIRIALNKNLGIPYRRKSMEVTGADLMYSNFLRLIAYA